MKKITILLLFFTTMVFGQEYIFDIHDTSLSKAINAEKKYGGKLIPNESTYLSGGNIAQPMRFQRKEKNIPDCIVNYTFYKQDSILKEIEYEWDVYNFEKQDNNQKSDKFEKALKSKYEDLKKMVAIKYSKPNIENNYSNLADYNQKSFFEESSTWKPKDSTSIKISTTISNYYEKNGAITINPTHRIRFSIMNTSDKKNSIPKLDDKKIGELNKIKNDFFEALKEKNFEKSKTFLTEILRQNATDNQINVLIDNLKLNKETVLIYSGIQMGMEGNMYTILQFKYSDDNSNPPTEMINIIFDDKNKIYGIKPIKLK